MVGSFEAAAQPALPVPTFKSAVDVVPITAVVKDQRGRLVTTLTSSDFQILDNGESQRILDFQSDGGTPITVAVLLDTSGSMRLGPKLALARDVLRRISRELREGQDEVGLFTFDTALHEQRPFSVHHGGIDAAFSGTEPFGTTSLYDAVADMADRLADRPTARRAIIVLTDGLDTESGLPPAEVSARASSVNVPVYVVVTVARIDRSTDPRRAGKRPGGSSADLSDLAIGTGGDLLWVSAEDEATFGARQIFSELRQQYLIAIESSPRSEWRSLDVRVRNRRLTVRARSGYSGSRD
jgi:VWFA-related protein